MALEVPAAMLTNPSIFQKTLHACAPFNNSTSEKAVDAKAPSIWNIKIAFGSFCASKVSCKFKVETDGIEYSYDFKDVFKQLVENGVIAYQLDKTLYSDFFFRFS